MDVRKSSFLAVACSLLFFGCAQDSSKTKESVFETKVSTNDCVNEVLNSKYIVQWEDGTFTYEEHDDIEKFKNEFVATHLPKIKKIYYDRKIQFLNKNVESSSIDVSQNAVSDQLWGQTMIQAERAWNQNVIGENVVVGVVDSYVDVTHPQLKNQILYNTKEIPDNEIDDDNNGYVDDYSSMNFTGVTNYTIKNEHGTHVAGIIAADHTATMKGMAPGAKIIPAPFIANDGSGSLGDAIKAMNYTVLRGAKVINASWGGSVCVTSLRDAFQAITDKGVLILVAAGNESRDLDVSPSYPAAFSLDGQITVGASNANDYMAYFSNSSFNLVHLAAPGDAIYSTTPGGKYNYLKGTSMATPFVSGAAALLWSAFPKASSLQIKDALVNSVDITPNHEFRVKSKGRMNVAKALTYLSSKFK